MKLTIEKYIKEDEFYLYMDGKLIYKRLLKTGEEKIVDVMAYDKYIYAGIADIECKGIDLICLKAEIKMRTSSEGGRKTGFASGYRPNHVFTHTQQGIWTESFMGDIVFDDSELIFPGEERIVTVRFLCYSSIERYMNVGRQWYIYEANKLLGTGEILEFI